ncbi:carboxymuconolactone decarboxylase family protein [Bradyrhizobium sp. LHD-71]|uniref:carboxymuconolactone decarboxylase family protein n=1 Tax=Bradyrhizobium sp. LHD-71 TaxID=3072141 RepID=UPI00280D78FA|nr:carboxymuconolactone decarboxylase family protein [Bradyrhizobium sp. LHD-71]MDQ8727186.1 carboxymuconolactone decarboxylase family protein [Bradyrhizobium sp. LHD-71]
MGTLDARRQALKDEFTSSRGYWSDLWSDLLEIDPDFFEAYKNFSSAPWKRKNGLTPKVRELIYVAIDTSTTHLYDPGTRIHMRNAIGHGATREELMEVMELTSVLGIHACSIGVPILLEEMEATGKGGPLPSTVLTAKQEALKAEFTKVRGYWSPTWDGLLRLSPDFFEAYLGFSGVPWKKGTLEPKVKEFIYIAIDAATTHLFEPGLRIHIRNALNYGATGDEIMEVLELISVLGIHTITQSVPIMTDELAQAGKT